MPKKAKDAPINEAGEEKVVKLSNEQFQEMMNRLSKLENKKEELAKGPQPQTGTPRMNEIGQPIGVTEKASLNIKDYENPVERLYDLPALKRFGMRENYVIDWNVTPTRYQTAFGTWFVEPRFELTLKRRRFDDDDKTIGFVILGRASFFEDLPANLLEAELAGLTTDDVGTPQFSDKMRMYRYSAWLAETIKPRRPDTTKKKVKLEVIGGQAWEVEEGNSVV
jgi:hypothetical protein